MAWGGQYLHRIKGTYLFFRLQEHARCLKRRYLSFGHGSHDIVAGFGHPKNLHSGAHMAEKKAFAGILSLLCDIVCLSVYNCAYICIMYNVLIHDSYIYTRLQSESATVSKEPVCVDSRLRQFKAGTGSGRMVGLLSVVQVTAISMTTEVRRPLKTLPACVCLMFALHPSLSTAFVALSCTSHPFLRQDWGSVRFSTLD